VVHYRGLGIAGEGDACHAAVTAPDGRTVVDARGPTGDAALAVAVRALRTPAAEANG
jgi:hypothetical protein